MVTFHPIIISCIFWSFKPCGSDQDNPAIICFQLFDQSRQRAAKVVQSLPAFQGFHRSKLSNHQGRFDCFQLLVEVTKSFPSPAILSPAFNHGSLAIDGVRFPCKVSKPDSGCVLAHGGFRHQCFEIAGLLLSEQIRASQKHHYVIRSEG